MAVGVVINATRPYKTPNSVDYVTKIKIIDEKLNVENVNINSDKKYIHVFIYSNDLSEAPVINSIGDIVYLKRFDVLLFDKILIFK